MKTDSKLPIRCEIFKELRKIRKLTQHDVAKKIDVTDKTYRSWENGEYKGKELVFPNPDLDSVVKLAELYDCSVDYLLGRSKCMSVENHYIEEYTGLCDDSIEVLHCLKSSNNTHDKNSLVTLNHLLTKINIGILLNSIATYFQRFFALAEGEEKKVAHKIIAELDKEKDVALFRANQDFLFVLKHVADKLQKTPSKENKAPGTN